MRRLIFAITAVVITLSSFSCREEEKIDDKIKIDGLGGVEYAENDVDRWLNANFVDTYNISVYYRWEAIAVISAFDQKLVPVKTEVVKPAMEAISHVWFTPYETLKGKEFLLEYAPKEIYLVGSAEWQSGGIKLGQAEGGKKIVLLYMNHLDPEDQKNLRQMMHVIQHEFAHILHQNKSYNVKFADISATDYSPNGWYNEELDDAYGKGFVSQYSMFSQDEDFVEVISRIMVYGYDWYLGTVLPAAFENGGKEAVDKLNRKLKFVESYFKDEWQINFLDSATGEDGLVTLVQRALSDVSQ